MKCRLKELIMTSGVILILGLITAVYAQLQTARIFNNGMVLQREMEIPVWGTANVDDSVIVTLNGQADTAVTDGNGRWKVFLPSMVAGGPYTMTIETNTTTLSRTNVYIGDVWLTAGQSNMALKLSESLNGAGEIASANNQTIRQFLVQNTLGNDTTEDVPSGSAWTAAVSSTVGNFTAVGYYFAKYLQQDISVPIGIINSSVGGARIEAYMSEEMLGYDEQDVRLANGERERQPTLVYNTMIHPLTEVPIKGIVWYQAESNGDNMEDAISYYPLFKTLITKYRDLWGLGDIPFIWVQLPNQGTAAVESSPGTWDAWPQLRENQSRALSLSNTGEATTIDVGAVDIHPTNKAPVGYRLSLAARKVAYGEDIIYSGPRYSNHTILDSVRVKIRFNHLGSGLSATGGTNDSVRWFSIADSTGALFQAKAVLDGDSVIVWNDNVSNPSVIRYAWEYNPYNVNLFNAENLPAVPFLINVVNPVFGINTYTTTDTLIERGDNVVLSWKVYGASQITLNGETVDSIIGIRMWPDDTIDYILKAVNNLDVNDTISDTITIYVVEPRPTITLKSSEGDMIAPGTETTLTATIGVPQGGTILNVDFFINDTLLISDTDSPYETTWTPEVADEYVIKAIVSDANGAEVESNIINMLVSNFVLQIYEAEAATRTGGGSVKSNSACSGGQYVDLTDAWTLTFNNVQAPETGSYLLSIRYLLNYESPKTQNLIVNGGTAVPISFEAANSSTWTTVRISVNLNAGANTIQIQGVWNWMSFDYIGIPVEAPVDGIKEIGLGLVLNQNTPNPVKSSTEISYSLPQSGPVTIEVFDITGRKVSVVVNEYKTAGTHTSVFDASKLVSGIYFYKFESGTTVLTKRMIVAH